ncbi:hypothetical protein C7441_102325 [Pseudaminobacter salicylatoxidans]|uniref:Tat pathway signal sequence domain protein n=1 Tax=Pseudaminobacter salicylatoxidans TaxID=93369 RepID=A0A316CCS5_PSESE|nr:hypothetical protein [Pseudaminobacter salicylatoxidans]PWJ85877.1 hypothetical protein C7441_102325 [Pseudaminobacter salicylatoxidans]
MFQATTFIRVMTSAVVLSLVTAGLAHAQESPAAPALTLELNGAEPSDKGCRLTFVVNNTLGGELSRAAFEIALFDDAGAVDRLTVLDFKELPAGKTKVSRFDLPKTDCTKISRVLINTATHCTGAGIAPDACLRSLKPQTRTDIKFGL